MNTYDEYVKLNKQFEARRNREPHHVPDITEVSDYLLRESYLRGYIDGQTDLANPVFDNIISMISKDIGVHSKDYIDGAQYVFGLINNIKRVKEK